MGEKQQQNEKPLTLSAPPLVSTYFGASLPAVPKIPAVRFEILKARIARPIYPFKKNILQTIEANKLSLISGSAGAGKTTQIPQYLLDDASIRKHRVRVICVVPHRLQAAAMAQIVSKERQEKLGETVGFHALLETCVSPSETLLTYSTYEALLRAFTTASNFVLDTTSHIIVDEIQELNPYAEMLLFYLVKALSEFPSLRVVILTNATVDQIKLMEHLTNLRRTCYSTLVLPIKLPARRVYNLPKLSVPKDSEFEIARDEAKRHEESENDSEKTGMSLKLNYEMIIGYVYYLDFLKPKSETMLVFLPDYSSLVILKRMILYHCSKKLPYGSFGVHLLHSGTKNKDYDKILASEPGGRRKIILATDIAESCLSLQASIVIDTGKIRREFVGDESKKRPMHWISKMSADERARRAAGGECYRLYNATCFNKMMDVHSLPGIRNHIINKLAVYGSCLLQDKFDAFGKFMQPISKSIIEGAYKTMVKQNVLDESRKITKLGIMALNLPIDPRFTATLMYGITFRCLDPILTLVAAMCLKDYYMLSDSALISTDRTGRITDAKIGGSAFSDHFEVIVTYKEWEGVLCSGGFSPTEAEFDKVAIFELLHGLRSGLVSQLRACGFIQPKGAGDMKELNTYSNNWPLVKAVLVIALMPHMLSAHPTKNILLAPVNNVKGPIELHESSVLSLLAYYDKHRTGWIVFEDLVEASDSFVIKACTLVTFISICIFGHDAYLYRCVPDLLDTFWIPFGPFGKAMDAQWQASNNNGPAIKITPVVLYELRNGVKDLVQKQIDEPGREYTKDDNQFLASLVELLTEEDKKLGIVLPENQANFGSGHARLGGGDLL